MNRREALFLFPTLSISAKSIFSSLADEKDATAQKIKPKALKSGSKIGIISPGSAVSSPDDIEYALKVLDYFEFEPLIAKNLKHGSGYKTRTIDERLDDLHEMFSNEEVDGIICIRGGYGAIQLLDKIDFNLIKSNPKFFAGFSDVTALLTAINKITGLATFHSPVLMSKFTEYTANNFRKIAFGEQNHILKNPDSKSGIRTEYPVITINSGKAKGELIGGNLSLITSLIGTDYEIDTNSKILIIEDVGESPYRIDRMLYQLKLAGKFDNVKGVAFGLCEDCKGGSSTWDFTTVEVIDNFFKQYDFPMNYGMLFGHTKDQLSFPIGVLAEFDTESETITILESPFI